MKKCPFVQNTFCGADCKLFANGECRMGNSVTESVIFAAMNTLYSVANERIDRLQTEVDELKKLQCREEVKLPVPAPKLSGKPPVKKK